MSPASVSHTNVTQCSINYFVPVASSVYLHLFFFNFMNGALYPVEELTDNIPF